MAISVMGWVWDHSESRHGARLVLLAIADCMKAADGWAWPSVEELQRKTRLTERAVRTAIGELADLGELEVARNAGPGGCNRYRVTPADFAGADFAGAEIAGVQNLHPSGSPQADGQGGADSAGANSAGVQKTTPRGANSAPGTVKNRKRSTTKKNVADDEPPRDDVERICAHLAESVAANGSKRPPVSTAWRTEARLLLDKDGRTEDQIHRAIDWCQANRFWRSKVMSLPKLREKYDQLRLDAEAEREKSGVKRRDYSRGGAGDPLDNEDYSEGGIKI